MKIIGPPTLVQLNVKFRLIELQASPLFVDVMFPELWAAAVAYHLDPVGVVAQSYKETAAGRFGGQITARWFNTCGLKVRDQSIDPVLTGDQPLAHAMFPSWTVGAHAHAQHLRAYTGWPVVTDLVVDPRYVWVIGRHAVTDYEQLGGRWAPSSTYGQQIVDIAATFREV
jgi:hypothetical protein